VWRRRCAPLAAPVRSPCVPNGRTPTQRLRLTVWHLTVRHGKNLDALPGRVPARHGQHAIAEVGSAQRHGPRDAQRPGVVHRQLYAVVLFRRRVRAAAADGSDDRPAGTRGDGDPGRPRSSVPSGHLPAPVERRQSRAREVAGRDRDRWPARGGDRVAENVAQPLPEGDVRAVRHAPRAVALLDGDRAHLVQSQVPGAAVLLPDLDALWNRIARRALHLRDVPSPVRGVDAAHDGDRIAVGDRLGEGQRVAGTGVRRRRQHHRRRQPHEDDAHRRDGTPATRRRAAVPLCGHVSDNVPARESVPPHAEPHPRGRGGSDFGASRRRRGCGRSPWAPAGTFRPSRSSTRLYIDRGGRGDECLGCVRVGSWACCSLRPSSPDVEVPEPTW
jgi:hypothetical protein